MIKIFEWMLTSSVLLGALLLLRRALWGKISRRLQYGLWLAAVLRLLIPFSLPAASSVANVAAVLPAQQRLSGQAAMVETDFSPAGEALAEETLPSAGEEENRLFPLTLLWAAGSAAVGGWFLLVNISFGRGLRRQRERYAADCLLPVYLVWNIPSSCLFGLFHPAVYITAQAAETPQMLRHVLAHEYCHFRQRDLFWSLLRVLCLTLHWFNPLVWAAAACSRTDCELACDERTMALLGEEQRLAYGETLLSLIRIRQSPAQLGCMATTMALGHSGLKKRIQMIAHAPKAALSGLLLAAVGTLALVSCTFTGAKPASDELLHQLTDSLFYEDGSVYFTLPGNYPNGEDWNIQIAGRAGMGEQSRSVHFFEKANAERSWKPGGEYQIDLSNASYQELWMEASLHSSGQSVRVDLLALQQEQSLPQGYQLLAVRFPAYEQQALQQNSLAAAASFQAQLALPEGWRIEAPKEPQSGSSPFYTVLDIVVGEGEGQRVATIGFNGYTPYEGEEELPPQEVYKTVYYELRLGRMEVWDPYTPVRTDESGESGIAGVSYLDEEYMREHPDAAMASVPVLETKGILCYQKELAAYVGIRFLPDCGVSEQQLQTIAASLQLRPEP